MTPRRATCSRASRGRSRDSIIPVFVNGQSFGAVVVAPQSSDESAEIWESITQFSVIGSLLAVATLLFMSLAVARLLRPIKTVGEALILLDAGNYDVAVPEGGPPEIADICGKLNRLAATLKATLSENHRLAQRIICIQDEERKDLARELHDELGPVPLCHPGRRHRNPSGGRARSDPTRPSSCAPAQPCRSTSRQCSG